ncbi:MAG TPA: 50S ribosomal protein L3 [Permianibacter sp.]|nr:50S ribosomal protein L3 [Permianibacter sp.]
MAIGLVGRKVGMTRVFNDDGVSVPVTVIEVEPNRITQVKTVETDGYVAVQVTTGSKKASRLNKPEAGHFAKSGVAAGRGLWEFRANADHGLAVGGELKVDLFQADQLVDVTGVTKGRGFSGTIRRWNFRGQDNTHGNSVSHRVPGSIGQRQTPGRVFKGMKMYGHYGVEQVTIERLKIVRVDAERNLLLVKGAVPGFDGADVIVKPAAKA